MPIQYTRDDTRRLIKTVATAPLAFEELLDVADRVASEGVWHYAILVDTRRAVISVEHNLAFLEHLEQMSARYGTPGPLAIVARDGSTVGRGQIFAARRAAAGQPAELFWDVEEADRWLHGLGH